MLVYTLTLSGGGATSTAITAFEIANAIFSGPLSVLIYALIGGLLLTMFIKRLLK